MNRDVVIAVVVGLVIGLAAMYAAAPNLPGMVRTSTTTLTTTKLVPTTIYRTVTTSTTVTTTTTTTLEKTRTVTLTATVTKPVTHTVTQTVTQVVTKTATVTATVTHIPKLSYEISYHTVDEYNASQIIEFTYAAKLANDTWVFAIITKRIDSITGNVIQQQVAKIYARLSKDRKTLILTWEPRVPFHEKRDVRVQLFDEKGNLIAQGYGKLFPGDYQTTIILEWRDPKAIPTKLVITVG